MVEKLSKYKDLEIKILRMWGLKTETVPVVIEALSLVKKGLEKYVKRIPSNINIEDLSEDQLTRHSSHFKKSALHKVDNNSPQQLPRKLVASRCTG